MQGRIWFPMGIIVGLLAFPLLAAPIEVTTEEDLYQLLDQVCQALTAEQTPSDTMVSEEYCAELRARLQHELRERLREYGVLTLDPEILVESMALAVQWIEANPGRWEFEEAAEMVLGLNELAKQYGDKLRDFLAQAKAAGYSPEELARFVTELAQNVTEDSPAKEALEEVLDSVEELLEEAEEHPEEIEEEHGKPDDDDEDHKATYDEDEKPGEDETNGSVNKGSDEDGDDEDDHGDRDHHGKNGNHDDEDEEHEEED